ncbi:hypothetical protein QRB41_14990 [Mycobacterium avium subsp. hominissuis]|uniref:hypothetical protein n=1 Tax=Mycobacterium avium TaxID=1764 RepID=UPI001140D943|nr:hypothetical protein [Mycobacterium avium]MDO2384673.1 hypothetical protein [Mycobacterium avium subsp. hominissuis]
MSATTTASTTLINPLKDANDGEVSGDEDWEFVGVGLVDNEEPGSPTTVTVDLAYRAACVPNTVWPADTASVEEREAWAFAYVRSYGRWPRAERGLAAERVAIVRRTIHRILGEAGVPLSLREIRDRLGGGDRSQRPHSGCASCIFTGPCTTQWCWCWHVSNRTDMKFLENAGMARRVATEPIRWVFVDPESDAAMNALLKQQEPA